MDDVIRKNVFNSCVRKDDCLKLVQKANDDLVFSTYLKGSLPNAHILMRTLSGGRDLWLSLVMADLLRATPVLAKRMSMPDEFKQYAFRSEAGPGTHFVVALADRMFGIRTVCHDETQGYDIGAIQGKGPFVWFSADHYPAIHAKLTAEFAGRGEDCQSFKLDMA